MTNPGAQPPPRRKRPSVEDGVVGVSRPGPENPQSAEVRLPLSWVIGGAVLLSLLMVGGMIAAFVAGREFGTDPLPVAASDTPQTSSTERANVDVDPGVLESVEKPVEAPSRDPEPVVVVDEASPEEMAEVDEPPQPEPEQPAPAPLPLADVINVHKKHLPLPSTEQNLGLSGVGTSAATEAAQLAKIYVDDPEKVTLRIEGQEAILPPGVRFAITEKLSPDRSMKIWEIAETGPTGVAAVGTKVGQFRLQDSQLSFQWQRNLQSAKLQFCRLVIEAENDAGVQSANCSLFEPVEQTPLRLNFDNVLHVVDLNLDARSLPRLEHLRMEVAVRGIDNSKYNVSGSSLTLTSPGDASGGITIDFYHPAGQRRLEDRIVRTAIHLAADGGKPPRLVMRNFAFLDQVRFDKQSQGGLPPDAEVVPPTVPTEYARSSEDRVRKEALNVLNELQGHRSRLKDMIAARRQKYSSVSQARSPNVARTQQAIARVKAELDEAEELEKQYALAEVVLARTDDRLRDLSEIHQQLERNVQVDVRLYLTHNVTQIDILRTHHRVAVP